MSYLVKFLFVGASLVSYYNYNYNLSIISICSIFLLSLVAIGIVSKQSVLTFDKASIGVALGYLLLFAHSMMGVIIMNSELSLKRFSAFLFLIFGALVAGKVYHHFHLKSLIKAYLVVHSTLFFLQFTTYYIGGYFIDLIEPITGEVQRVFHGQFHFPTSSQRFFRAAGLFNEPGTYSTFMAPFIALFGQWSTQSKTNKCIFFISLSSLFLSASVYGAVFGCIILMTSKNIKIKTKILILFLSFAILAPYFLFRFSSISSSNVPIGIDLRWLMLVNSWNFLVSDITTLIFGSNLLGLDLQVEYVAAFNDIGLLFYLFHTSGIITVTVLFIVLIMWFVKANSACRVALIVVLLSKHSLFTPFFPFLLVSIFWKGKE